MKRGWRILSAFNSTTRYERERERAEGIVVV
jgi:hypothetical protein